jgi:hypothetical protein
MGQRRTRGGGGSRGRYRYRTMVTEGIDVEAMPSLTD